MAISDVADVGTTVQFHVRDAASADEDLRELMAPRAADAAPVSTRTGRGTHLFGKPHHDARVVSEQLDGAPVAGMFCAASWARWGPQLRPRVHRIGGALPIELTLILCQAMGRGPVT